MKEKIDNDESRRQNTEEVMPIKMSTVSQYLSPLLTLIALVLGYKVLASCLFFMTLGLLLPILLPDEMVVSVYACDQRATKLTC